MDSKLQNLLFLGLILGAIALFVVAKTFRPKTAAITAAIAPPTQCSGLSSEVQKYIDSKCQPSSGIHSGENVSTASLQNQIANLQQRVAELKALAENQEFKKIFEDFREKEKAEGEQREAVKKKGREEEFESLKARVLQVCKGQTPPGEAQ